MKLFLCILSLFICLSSNVLIAQNAPITTAGTFSTVGSTATISITASDFNNIASCNLELNYDSTIARATAVTTGPLLGGGLSSDLSVPGKIALGWYTFPAITLEGDPILFNITFARLDTGTTALTWFDDGHSCIFCDGNFNTLNDIPTSTYYINGALTFQAPIAPVVTVPVLHGNTDRDIDIPVSVIGFNDVGKFTLTLNYDASVITYSSFTNGSFSGLTIDGSTPGTIVASGLVSTGVSGITLPDSAILFTLHFKPSVGTTSLTWSADGTSCEFFGPPPAYDILTDNPKNQHYVDGSVTVTFPFGIAGEGVSGNKSLNLSSSPNPFSENVKLAWFLQEKGQALVEIRNLSGEKITTLLDEVEQQGDHTLQLSSLVIQPGIYIATITLTTTNETITKSIKMIKE